MGLGSRFDQWLTTDPYQDEPDIPVPGDEFYPRCSKGHFLKRDTYEMRYEETTEHCTGEPQEYYESGCDSPQYTKHEPHDFVAHVAEFEVRTCKCGEVVEICVGAY